MIQSECSKTGEEREKSEMAVIFRKDFKVKMWALICYWHSKMGQVMSHFMWAFQDQNQEEN